MLEFLQHLIGVCPDTHHHINIIFIINEINKFFPFTYIKFVFKNIKTSKPPIKEV